jgi:hypothetical protein
MERYMKKSIAFSLVFVSMLSIGFILFPVVSGQSTGLQAVSVKVLSYSWYKNPTTSDIIVVGEAQNTGTSVLDYVGVSGTIFTSDGQPQAYSGALVYVNQMLPQQKAPFYIDFPPQSSFSGNLSWPSLGIDHVNFTANGNSTINTQYQGLQIRGNNSQVDSTGAYTVQGVVWNNGNQDANTTRVIATFYNASGTTIAVGFTDPLTPDPLPPNGIAQFTVTAFDSAHTLATQITSYSLLIQVVGPLSGSQSSPGSSATPLVSETPGSSSSPGSSTSPSEQPTQSPVTGQAVSMETIELLAIVAVVIVVVVVVVALMLRKRGSTSQNLPPPPPPPPPTLTLTV